MHHRYNHWQSFYVHSRVFNLKKQGCQEQFHGSRLPVLFYLFLFKNL
jgi:hypothetical protein